MPVVTFVVNRTLLRDPRRFLRRCRLAADDRGWKPWFVPTSEAVDGLALTRRAVAAGASLVFAAGGDGTVRACAEALAGTGVPLAIVPLGTANLTARALGVPAQADRAVGAGFDGRDRRIDLALLDGTGLDGTGADMTSRGGTGADMTSRGGTEGSATWFAAMAGIGLDAAVVEAAGEQLKRRLGWVAYGVAGVTRLSLPPRDFTVRLDDAEPLRRRARCVVVANAGLLPGGFTLLPEARLDDGLLDVGILAPSGTWGWVRVAGRVLTRGRRQDRPLERFQARRVQVSADVELPRQVDGEIVAPGQTLSVSVCPGVLVVRQPETGQMLLNGFVPMRVPLSLACGTYDRTLALARGDIQPEGIDLTYLALPVEETFFRMTRHREFDAAEMSLSSYLISLDQDAPFVAIPAFVSRAFRHNGIYVSPASGITTPAGLAGRVVGLAEYQLTANVWIRGILAERHGLPVAAVRYRTGGLHEPGRVAKLAHDPPPGVDIEPIPPGATLADMLAAGQIDALYTPRVPRTFGPSGVRRLFADPRGEEERYFAATGIFPVMHVVVLRRKVYEQRPWLAQSLYKAFEQSRREAAARLAETAAGASLLPWAYAEAERTQNVMGRDFWTYGLAGNEQTLRTFIRYSFEQGLIRRQPSPAELFADETREAYVI